MANQAQSDCSLIVGRKWGTLRRKFLPKRVRVLFIGESPPASGRFFYRGDSGLYRAVRDLFQTADPSVSEENFLYRFRECGCYLIDTCPDPVNHLDPQARRAACVAGEPSLVRDIRRLQPETIVSLMRSIRDCIDRAAAKANWCGPILDVPYPGRWIRHRRVFMAKLLPYIQDVVRQKLT
jgi:hypothetical protein